MSLVSLTIYPRSFGHPTITNNNKWTICRLIAPSKLFSDHRTTRFSHHKKTQTSLLTKAITSPSTPNKRTCKVTKATPTTTMMLELEKKRKVGFWFRKWDLVDVTSLCWVGSMHVLAGCAPFVFTWDAFLVGMVLTQLTGLGVTLGYHRLLTHRSFKVPKWFEYFFVYCAAQAGQKDPIFWVSVHKNHHKNVETEKDPHTPNEGFWFSHLGWVFHNDYIATKCGESKSGEYSNVPELKDDGFYRFLHHTYFLHPIGLGTLLYLYGGFPYLAWGMGMQIVMVYHITSLANSVCHLWGERPWNTCDTSTNNWWVAMLTLGEGWHNNHHAFPKSARHGLEWWQFDWTWQVINFLQTVGLATNVKLPTETEKKRMTLLN